MLNSTILHNYFIHLFINLSDLARNNAYLVPSSFISFCPHFVVNDAILSIHTISNFGKIFGASIGIFRVKLISEESYKLILENIN
jgi:hypothetical protein